LAEVVGAALRLVQGSHIKRSRHSFHFISFRFGHRHRIYLTANPLDAGHPRNVDRNCFDLG